MGNLKAKDDSEQTLIERIASRRTALTLREFAELYSISYRTAFEMATQGRIPAMQIGANWRIDPIELAVWLRDQKITASGRNSQSRVLFVMPSRSSLVI